MALGCKHFVGKRCHFVDPNVLFFVFKDVFFGSLEYGKVLVRDVGLSVEVVMLGVRV